MDLKRHSLVEISHQGRKKAFQWLKETIYSEEQLAQIFQLVVSGYNETLIPSIVRRKEKTNRKGVLAVGFSSPFLMDGNRIRIPAFIQVEDIEAVITPYELLARNFSERTNVLKTLKVIRDIAEQHQIMLGVFGSAGMEIYTGLPYTHEDSDLDLIIKSKDLNKIKLVYSQINDLAMKQNIKADIELELGDCEIKLAELFIQTGSILGKGINDVRLYSRAEVLKMISSPSSLDTLRG